MESRSPEDAADRIEGVVERIVFVNPDNAWSVVRLAVRGRHEPVTAVGNLLGVQAGESLRLTGRWTRDRKYGEQLAVESFETVQPATLTGVERYLGSGLIRGVGKTLARRLVARFGLDTLDVIDRHPERLAQVEGIGPVRVERIRAAWKEQREIKEVMVFLQSHGISTLYATKIYRRYGADAIAVVEENPYRLATDIWGIGFKTADRIAASLGIPSDSPQRAEAGLLHALTRAADEGHLFVPRGVLLRRAARLLGIGPQVLADALATLAARRDQLVVEGAGEDGEAVYLALLHSAEVGLAERVAALLAEPLAPMAIDLDRALAWFEKRRGLVLAEQQRAALRKAIHAKMLILTGGPGTGKTTLVQGIVEIMERKGRRVLLAAPTGRAAKRLTEATGREAKTVHRLLEFSPKKGGFDRGLRRPLEGDVIVVDEASMLDAPLAYHLFRAVPDTGQVILVGDVDQLPSVGPGLVLGDLIRSGRVDVVRLTEIFRQAAASLIVSNAHRINRGAMPLLEPEGDDADFFFVERDDPEDVIATVKHLITERIPRRFRFDPAEEIQVLTPMRRGLLGANQLNAELQALLNPAGSPVTGGGWTLRVGDKVMQVRNNYDLEVFNGDIGRVVSTEPVERVARVAFDGRIVEYDFTDLGELALAYACSVHKAQGSEYPCVVMPLHTQHFVMLQRNLLYTAVTRARRLLVLVGSRRALAQAVGNSRIRRRNSRLAERLAAV